VPDAKRTKAVVLDAKAVRPPRIEAAAASWRWAAWLDVACGRRAMGLSGTGEDASVASRRVQSG
jgi:hypothetical protein